MKKVVIWIVFVLVFFGLTILSSAGIAESQRISNSRYYFFTHQLLYGLIPGLLAFFVASKIKPSTWKKISFPLFVVSIILLILVFIPGLGISLKGSQRWLNLGLFSFQPSELLKLSLVLYLAAWFSKKKEIKSNNWSMAPFLALLFFIILLLAKQPDIGTLIVIIAIMLVMYFASGAKIIHILGLILLIAIIGFVLIKIAPYRLNRLLAFMNPNVDTLGISYHVNQSILSIGSGGLFGVGFGKGIQKTGFLPEPVGDSIFAVLGEELGLLGMTVLIGLFIALFVCLLLMASKTNDKFSKLTLIGIACWIGTQAIVNIAAASGIFPFTGIPLPFISYGGTSLAILLAAMGICVSLSEKCQA